MKMNKTQERGFTLFEVLMAMLIILIVAVGGGAFIYYSSGNVAVERNRRIALEVANSRLEEIKASDYDDIIPRTGEGIPLYDDAEHTTEGTVSINGIDRPIYTTVQYVDVDEGTPSYDYLRIAVSIEYSPDPNRIVTLETYLGP